MDFEPEGTSESLIPSAQERTAQRTHYLLVAAQLAFLFSHGALFITASLTFGLEGGASWWAVFVPVWLGNTACMVLICCSWFASCPYIQLCLHERQARLGEGNPSILTELLPEIVMAIPGLLFIIFALIAELMLCRYLDRGRRGEPHSVIPCAVAFILLAILTTCRGVCIRTNGELYSILGIGTLATFVVALCVPEGFVGESCWVIGLPPLLSCMAFLVATVQRLKACATVLSSEERRLRKIEQVLAALVLIALVALVYTLSQMDGKGDPSGAAAAGGMAGLGMCSIAAVRARMALVESRISLVRDRLQLWHATALSNSGPQARSPRFSEPTPSSSLSVSQP